MNISGNSISALNAFGTGMGVTSNNVANVNSDGFKSSRTVIEEGQNGSVNARIQKSTEPGPMVQDNLAAGGVKEGSNVDLAREITSTIPTQRGYEANLKMVKTQDEMLGTVIDMKA